MDIVWNTGIIAAVYGLIGSIYLAKGLAFVTDTALHTQAKVPNDFNFLLLRNLCEQRFDTRLGLIFIIFAMVWQLISFACGSMPMPLLLFVAAPIPIMVVRRVHRADFTTAVEAAAILLGKGESVTGLRLAAFPAMKSSEWEHAVQKAQKLANSRS